MSHDLGELDDLIEQRIQENKNKEADQWYHRARANAILLQYPLLGDKPMSPGDRAIEALITYLDRDGKHRAEIESIEKLRARPVGSLPKAIALIPKDKPTRWYNRLWTRIMLWKRAPPPPRCRYGLPNCLCLNPPPGLEIHHE